MVTIDEHTFDESLLNKNSMVLDIGARGFGFSRWIAENIECHVTAIDADPEIENPNINGVRYLNQAVTCANSREVEYYSFGNGTANYTNAVAEKPGNCKVFHVPTFKIEAGWDLIKMDCEGCEYDILMNMTEPLANQLSIEFHEHTVPKGDEYMNNLFEKLSAWYAITNKIKEPRHGCVANYWDVLFTLK